MTIEEKAKAYDEALERAKYALTTDMDNSGHWAVNHIFPELAESEDEKIRKDIIDLLKELLELGGIAQDTWDRKECEKYIAWLEKQGELVSSLTIGLDNAHERIDKLIQKNNKLISQLEEKQREQKPTWSEEEKKKLDRIYYILGIAADEHAYSNTCRLIGDKEAVELQDFLHSIAKPEQNPAWSEEDESHIRYLIECLECCKKGAALTMPTSTSQEYINWLKSLRPQKKQTPVKWSEDEKEIWNKAEKAFPNSGNMQSGFVTGYKEAITQ